MLNEKEHVLFVLSFRFLKKFHCTLIIDDNSIVEDETNCAHLGW